jgi:hypothetical protein
MDSYSPSRAETLEFVGEVLLRTRDWTNESCQQVESRFRTDGRSSTRQMVGLHRLPNWLTDVPVIPPHQSNRAVDFTRCTVIHLSYAAARVQLTSSIVYHHGRTLVGYLSDPPRDSDIAVGHRYCHRVGWIQLANVFSTLC